MRVLLLNYEYPPLGGGAGVATGYLARGLVARGHRADVVTAKPLSRDHERTGTARADDPAEPGRDRLRVFRVGVRRRGLHHAGWGGSGGYVVSAWPVVRALARRHSYDVIHAFFSLPTGLLLLASGLRDVPVVLSLRGSDVPGYDEWNRSLRWLHRVLWPLNRRIWRRADRLVALSEALGELVSRADPGVRFTVIRNGVDLELFHPPPARPSSDRVRCLAVTRLIPRKGLENLMRAFGRLPSTRYELEIVGSGAEERSLRSRVRDGGRTGTVTFSGPLPHARVAERLREADLFTLVPYAESFGNAFAEAMASGLPIVGARVGGIPEYVRHETHGLLVEPDDVGAIARAIARLGDDPELRARMGREGRRHAERELSWDRVTDRYLALYREVTHDRASDRPRRSEGARQTPAIPG